MVNAVVTPGAQRPIPAIEHNWEQSDYLLTYTGKKFYPSYPEALEVDIIDIAHALSNVCRYNGHLRSFYSVGQHSVLVANYVQQTRPEMALMALLHDASEAYLPDVPSPVKLLLPDFIKLESRLHAHIFKSFKLKWPYPSYIKEVDKAIRIDEMQQLQQWEETVIKEPLGIRVIAWEPWEASEMFLSMYNDLISDVS